MNMNRRSFWLPVLLAAALAVPAFARVTWDGSERPQGVYFYWYEPSFYTGFAPRTDDPNRLHVRLGRGNQVRVTMTLGDEELDTYLEDLVERRRTYQEVIDAGVIELTTNLAYEQFVERFDGAGVAAAAEARASMAPDAFRTKTVEIMSALNPERIFPIRMPVERVVADWHALLTALPEKPSDAQKLDAANAVLPGRVNVTALGTQLSGALAPAMASARTTTPADPTFHGQALTFLQTATDGRYPVRDDAVTAIEFTTLYPAGTVEGWVNHQGERIPGFGVTGVWNLVRRKQGRGITGMVDYLSPNPGYGFIPMLPYQHAGGIYYNAFHNAGVRSQLNSTPFLPKEWRTVAGARTPEKNYQNLWIVSRGPASHGCTRLASGHMTEFRQIVPVADEQMVEVRTFRNLPQCFDVFDIDGDFAPEVMGVQYYLAYRSQKHTPVEAYVPNNREEYYRWLYGDHIEMAPVGQAKIRDALTCRFVGKKAVAGQVRSDVPLYEATFAPETMQFYRVKPVNFETKQGIELNRELRKVGHGHTTDRAKILLD